MSYQLMHIHDSLPTQQRIKEKSKQAIELVERGTRIFAGGIWAVSDIDTGDVGYELYFVATPQYQSHTPKGQKNSSKGRMTEEIW